MVKSNLSHTGMTFYCQWHANIRAEDKLIELKIDKYNRYKYDHQIPCEISHKMQMHIRYINN